MERWEVLQLPGLPGTCSFALHVWGSSSCSLRGLGGPPKCASQTPAPDTG